jgi:hypothetical protein
MVQLPVEAGALLVLVLFNGRKPLQKPWLHVLNAH